MLLRRIDEINVEKLLLKKQRSFLFFSDEEKQKKRITDSLRKEIQIQLGILKLLPTIFLIWVRI